LVLELFKFSPIFSRNSCRIIKAFNDSVLLLVKKGKSSTYLPNFTPKLNKASSTSCSNILAIKPSAELPIGIPWVFYVSHNFPSTIE